ncbi:DUF6176 family protein [Miniphocaeibacter massiliensis]|uniref:DUF6176 family protein n=1 Tax=Miniphocaeibacter massiliensis TaxID=2041841 RepID=UPI000C073E3F|nr:DUF6176 family protein [Miniphocaeibacter massiliensis]
MKNLDVKLYKMKIKEGKEDLARKWIQFIVDNKEEAQLTLEAENTYLESYFLNVEDGNMFIYLFMASDDTEYANMIAGNSKDDIHLKFFDYSNKCVDREYCEIINCDFYINNF